MIKIINLRGVARITANFKAYVETFSERKAEKDLSNVDAAHFRSLDDRANIVTTTGTGAEYHASVPGITALVPGVSFTMIPHTTSTTKTATLNVNDLGAKNIRQPLTSNTGATTTAALDSWLTQGQPIRVTYNGTLWEIDIPRPSAAYLYGVVPVANGGTGADNKMDALAMLNAAPKTALRIDTSSGAKSIKLTPTYYSEEWRFFYDGGIPSLKLDTAGTFSYSTDLSGRCVFRSGATATTITNTMGAYFTGDDCADGVFTPSANKIYTVDIWWNGMSWQAAVRGAALA